MTDKKYAVGQVIYVVSSKQMKVVPCLVTEENVKKTLKTDSVEYKVVVGKNEKQVDLKQIAGEIFDDLETVRTVLQDRASKSVNRMLEVAKKAELEWYGELESINQEVSSEAEADQDDFVDDTNVEFEQTSSKPISTIATDEFGKPVKLNLKLPDNWSYNEDGIPY